MADVTKKSTKATTKAAPKAAKTAKTTKVAKKATEVKTFAQLNEELSTLRHDHQESRRSHRMGELVNPKVLLTQRKDIARTLTAMKQSVALAKKEDK